MKTRLPHLIYLSLLLGSTFYFWRTLHNEKQLREFLHRPADETYTVMWENNLNMRDEIQRNISGYSSEYNLRTRQRMFQADALIKWGLASRISRDSLRSGLDSLVPKEKKLVQALSQVLPSQKPRRFSGEARLLMAQNDSLRQQMALVHMQNYFASQVGGLEIKFDKFEPVFSPTTLCPTTGQPFMTDVVLSDNPRWLEMEQIRVNGDTLPIDNGVGIFRHTFDTPGDYPLTVEAKVFYYRSSKYSVVTTGKTFLLHINR